MTTAVPSAQAREALSRIESWRHRFGEGHFYLACHAALPLALTPDLLYCLWENFQRDTHGEAIEISWIAVADLMLSSLCEEVGNELYEMDAAVRDTLLSQLQQDPRFGLARVQKLADFVMTYVEQELDHPDLDTRDLAKTQKLRALAYKQPHAAAHEIALMLTQLNLKDKTEWLRMAALLNSLAEPLAAFQPLLDYIQAMANLARGNLAAAATQMNKAVDADRQVRVEGVNLPIPDAINSTPPPRIEPEAPPLPRIRLQAPSTPLPNKLRFRVAIAGGTIVSLLVLIGIQYGLRSPTPQPTPISSSPLSPRSSPSISSSLATPSVQVSSLQPSPSASPSTQSLVQSPPRSSTSRAQSSATVSPSPSRSPTAKPSPTPSITPIPTPSLSLTFTPPPSPSSQQLSALESVQANQKDFAADLATLRGRVTALESRVSSLERGDQPLKLEERTSITTESYSVALIIEASVAKLDAQITSIQTLASVSSGDMRNKVAVIRLLAEEFAAEVATLRGRSDALKARLISLSELGK